MLSNEFHGEGVTFSMFTKYTVCSYLALLLKLNHQPLNRSSGNTVKGR